MRARNGFFKVAIDYLYKEGKVGNQEELCKITGINPATISRILNDRVKEPSDETIRKLNKAFDNIFNLPYFRGESVYLLAADAEASHEETATATCQPSRGRPYYNVDFAAGFDLMINDQTVNPDYFIDFRPYNDCDVWCNCHGNSMYPTIASGDVVAMKRIIDFRYLINGEIYGIVTSNGLRTIKRVRDNGDTLTLIPDNKEVAEQTIPKSIVTHVYLIKGALKQF